MGPPPRCHWGLRFLTASLLLLGALWYWRFQAGQLFSRGALGVAGTLVLALVLTFSPKRWWRAFFSLALVAVLGGLGAKLAHVEMGVEPPGWWNPAPVWLEGLPGMAFAAGMAVAVIGAAVAICGVPGGKERKGGQTSNF